MKKTLADLTTEEISGILNTAMDDGEWHTPSAHDISIKSQTSSDLRNHEDESEMWGILHSGYSDMVDKLKRLLKNDNTSNKQL
jgi:hypothetical protein